MKALACCLCLRDKAQKSSVAVLILVISSPSSGVNHSSSGEACRSSSIVPGRGGGCAALSCVRLTVTIGYRSAGAIVYLFT